MEPVAFEKTYGIVSIAEVFSCLMRGKAVQLKGFTCYTIENKYNKWVLVNHVKGNIVCYNEPNLNTFIELFENKNIEFLEERIDFDIRA